MDELPFLRLKTIVEAFEKTAPSLPPEARIKQLELIRELSTQVISAGPDSSIFSQEMDIDALVLRACDAALAAWEFERLPQPIKEK